MSDGSCEMCLAYGTVVVTERDGQVLRLRHDPCPTCYGTHQGPADDEHGACTRRPSRIAAQMAARLLDHGVCPHCLGAGRVVDLGDGYLPTRVVEAPGPVCVGGGGVVDG